MKQIDLLLFTLCMAMVIPTGFSRAFQVYVSPSGDDSNPGTFDQPYASIPKAHSVVSAGDTIYIRGGVYPSAVPITLNKTGTDTAKLHLLAYQEERAQLDFSSMPVSSGNRGIILSGDYWYIRGLDIKGAGDNGMIISGTHNTVEYSSFFENRDTGLQLSNSAAYNRIINCDSYFNSDPGQGNADGFAPKLSVGDSNYFFGCRAWQNSDDGFDGYLRESLTSTTVLENCWMFMNGYLADGSPSSGNGNGFKMGGGDNGNSDSTTHNITLINCLAFDNRVKGFDQNNNRGSMTIYNGTAYRNGTNFSLPGAVKFGETATVINGVSFQSSNSIANHVIKLTNSWMLPFSVTADDFRSIDTTGVRGPRKSDGSLPDIDFMHLAEGSDLINGGTDVGLPFHDTAPDLGAFEFIPVTSVVRLSDGPSSFSVQQNYPNPFNPVTTIRFEIPNKGVVAVQIFNILGQRVKEIANEEFIAGVHSLQWDATNANGSTVASGIYIATIQYGAKSKSLKLTLVK